MKTIVIKRLLKTKCPVSLSGPWSYYKIPSVLWDIWDKREIDESLIPDIYTDQMDGTISNYSRNYPNYYWDWCIM